MVEGFGAWERWKGVGLERDASGPLEGHWFEGIATGGVADGQEAGYQGWTLQQTGSGGSGVDWSTTSPMGERTQYRQTILGSDSDIVQWRTNDRSIRK